MMTLIISNYMIDEVFHLPGNLTQTLCLNLLKMVGKLIAIEIRTGEDLILLRIENG